MESDFLILVPDFGIIYVEVKRTDRTTNLTKAAAQIEKIKDLLDIITLQCLGIKLVCVKVSLKIVTYGDKFLCFNKQKSGKINFMYNFLSVHTRYA